MKRFAALSGGLASISSVLAVAAAAAPAPAPATAAPSSYVSTTVGPGVYESTRPAAAGAPAPSAGGGASSSEVISGTVTSTAGVRIDTSSQATYSGTEPATMTVSRDGSGVTVTVVPR